MPENTSTSRATKDLGELGRILCGGARDARARTRTVADSRVTLRPVTRASRQAGVSAPIVLAAVRVLREAGVALADPEQQAGYVIGALADGVLEDGAKALHDPMVGLTVASRLAPGSLGPLDYVLFTSETWGAALTLVAKYYAVASERVRMSIEQRGTETAIVLRREPPYEQNRFWVELSLALIGERARQSLGTDWKPIKIDFMHPSAATTTGHAAWFDAPVAFSASSDQLVFASKWMDTRSHTAMGSLAAVLESRLAELVPPDADPLMLRIRDAIAHGMDAGQLEIANVAQRLAMSTRSLQRALSQRGVKFTDVVDDIRRARALEYLRAGETIAQVADKVGFSDPSALFRAYRRWTGTTPGADRDGD
jgi:AraC-like DNA-binding protein